MKMVELLPLGVDDRDRCERVVLLRDGTLVLQAVYVTLFDLLERGYLIGSDGDQVIVDPPAPESALLEDDAYAVMRLLQDAQRPSTLH